MNFLKYLLFVPGIFGLFAAGDGGLRGAVSDLGGGAEPGGEPDIFEGGDLGGGEGDTDAEPNDGGDPGASEDVLPEDDGTGDGEPEPEPASGEEGEEPGEETPPSDEEGTEEPGEEPATEPKPAAKPQTEEEKAIEKTLSEAYRDNPKFKEMFKAYPEARLPFFRAAQINKIFPGGVEEAGRAKEWAQDLFKIDQLYYGSGPQDVKSKRDFLKMMWDESLDKQGQSTGHYEALSGIVFGDTIANIEGILASNPALAAQISKELNPKQVATALEIVRRAASIIEGKPVAGARTAQQPLTPDLGPDAAQMSPRERKLAEQLAAANAQLNERHQTESAASEARFNQDIWNNFYTGIKPELDKRMPSYVKTGSGKLQTWFVNDVINTLTERMKTDEFFDAQLKAVARSGDRGQEHVAQIGNMIKQRALTLLPTVVRETTAELVKKADTNNQGQGTSQSGKQRPRREPAVSGTPGRVVKTSGRSDQSRGNANRDRSPVKSTGDYMRDANRLLGIE